MMLIAAYGINAALTAIPHPAVIASEARQSHFSIRYSLFDIRYSLSSPFSLLTFPFLRNVIPNHYLPAYKAAHPALSAKDKIRVSAVQGKEMLLKRSKFRV
jgi:hypothetical protein